MSDLSISAITAVSRTSAFAGGESAAGGSANPAPASALEALVASPSGVVETGGTGGALTSTLTNGVAALGAAPEASTTWTEAQTPGGHEAATAPPSQTLALMAQAGPRPETLVERPGTVGEAGLRDNAAAVTGWGDSQVAPLQTELQATVAVASLLHIPSGSTSPRAAGVEDPTRHGGGFDHDDGGADESDSSDQDEAPTTDDQVGAPRRASPGIGDPELYQRLLAGLRAAERDCEALGAILAELRRQRCVLLVTPVGLPAGERAAAHVDVLWPRATGGRALRFAGELHWPAAPAPAWWTSHVVKTQSEGHVRRLAPVVTGTSNLSPVQVLLGAQARPPEPVHGVCLRVRESTRFWRALEPQWSLRIALHSRPLSDPLHHHEELAHGP